MQLKELQKQFFQSLHENQDSSELLECIEPSKTLTPAELVDIYRNSFKNGLIYELKRLYSACCKLIGEDRFYVLCEEYIQKHTPSPESFLNYYGEYFADKMVESSIACEVPSYLPDVARFEWLIRLSYMEKLEKGNGKLLEDLSKVSQEEQEKIIFQMPTNAFLFESQYPIDKIWRWVEVEDVESVDMKKSCRVFLCYKNQKLQFSQLKEQEYQLLKLVEKKNNFGQIYDTMQDASIIAMLPKFVQRGYINNFKVE